MAKDLDYFKKKIMAILEKQTDEAPKEINKSLNDIDFIYNTMNPGTFGEIEKSRGYGIGTVREWKGRKYRKIAPNKWRLIYESDGKGARQSIAYLKKAVKNAKSTDELLEIVMQNVNRFQDANGKTLDIVMELQNAVKEKKTTLNGKKPAQAAETKTPEQKKEPVKEEPRQEEKKEEKPKEPAKEEPKEEKPVEPEKKTDDNEAVKAEMKKWKDVYNKYYDNHNTGVGHWLDWVERPGQSVHSKAYGKAAAIKNLIAMREGLKNDFGIDTPEIPQEILDRYNDYSEKIKGVPGYAIGSETNKILSSYKNSKLRDAFNAIMQPVKDKYFEAKNKLVTEEIPEKADIVPGKSNEEQAELFELRRNPNDEEEEILYYNGKPYGNDGEKGYGYSNPLEDMKDMVRAVGMDGKAQAQYVFDKFNNNKDEVAYQWSLDSAIKKYGEEKLKELAKPSMSDEEFIDKLKKECEKKSHTYKWIAGQARNHVYNKMVEATAQKYLDQLTSANSAINDVDIPVDPKDMEEAESIIGHKVDRILARTDSYGKSLYRAELKKMIEARIRNKPGVARAMLVYIKNKQAETGQTIFTPKNEIWNNLQKLNENAINSVMAGESETKGGTSGNLYSGDGVSSVVEDKDAGRYQVTFNGKPDAEIRNVLKQNGFRWAPSLGVWQCYNTANGERSLARVAEKLGWKKGE